MHSKLQESYFLSRSAHETVREWWWATSEALELVSGQLSLSGHVIIDHFLTNQESNLLQDEVTISISIPPIDPIKIL